MARGGRGRGGKGGGGQSERTNPFTLAAQAANRRSSRDRPQSASNERDQKEEKNDGADPPTDAERDDDDDESKVETHSSSSSRSRPHDDDGAKAPGNGSSFYDAKEDSNSTQMDLHVSKKDPVSARSTEAVKRHRAQDDVEEHVNLARVRRHAVDGALEEVAAVDDLDLPQGCRSVLYWMQREQRVEDNWPLLWAREVAEARGLSLLVVFCMVPKFLDATERQFGYMIRGMREVEADLRLHGVPFTVLLGYAYDELPRYVEQHRVGLVVNDFNPLRCHREWVTKTAAILANRGVEVHRVDGHNTVPMWVASDKLESAARTIRGKIHRHLPTFLREYPPFTPPSAQSQVQLPKPVDWKAVDASLDIDRSVGQLDWIQPGEKAAKEQLTAFLEQRLKHFNTRRNDPTHYVLSNMSCYLHYGMISAGRVVLQAMDYKSRYGDAVSSFVEEIVVRRELSDNFVWHEPNYDNFHAAKDWARDSLNAHKADRREFLYTLGEFECCVTHDDLWNAAQLQLNLEGKMHGFLRMYWCKKILEWTTSPEQAQQFAIFLNDRYELDGRDPNGYVGIAWSILGIHDQGWAERPIFGKVRYMNYKGCKRKFDVDAFVRRYPDAKVGSRGFKANEQRAKELDERRAREGPREDPSTKVEGTGGEGPNTKRTHRVKREEKEEEDENEAHREDEDDDVGGGQQAHHRGARKRVEEQKAMADDDGKTPAGGGKRARLEKPH